VFGCIFCRVPFDSTDVNMWRCALDPVGEQSVVLKTRRLITRI
jgi:hypothetical protein